jgi:hypothetical protein
MRQETKTKTIVWLEDRRETIVEQKILCENLGVTVVVHGTLFEFKRALAACHAESQDVLIAVDVDLKGVRDLTMLGFPDVSTTFGADAGWLVVEHFLRPRQGEGPYQGRPVLVFTVLPVTKADRRRIEDLNLRAQDMGLPIVKLVEKEGLSFNKEMTGWQEFNQLIRDWVDGKPWV